MGAEEGGPWRGPDDAELRDMARRLRAEADAERTEQEQLHDEHRLRTRGLAEVALAAMMEGDRWQVRVGDRTFDGSVAHVGTDFVGLTDDAGNLFDTPWPSIDAIHVLERRPAAGRAPTTFRPARWRARLEHFATDERDCELGARIGKATLAGRIEIAASDHLMVRLTSGGATIVPLSAVAYVIRRPVEHRRTPPQRPR